MKLDEYKKFIPQVESLIGDMNFCGGADYNSRVFHAVLGFATEAGEILDPIKKYAFYGKDLDITNIREEIGDVLWYSALFADCFDISLEGCKKWASTYPPKSGSLLFKDVSREVDYALWDASKNLCSISAQMMETFPHTFSKSIAEYFLNHIFKNIIQILNCIGGSLEEEAERNYNKLNARFKDGFSSEKAINRDLDTERTILEG